MEGHKRTMPAILANDIELTSHLLQEDISPSNTPSPISDEFRILHHQPNGTVQYNQQRSCTIPHLGIIMAVLSSFCFSVCSLIVKQMKDMNPIELAMYRFAGILLPTLPILFYKNLNPFPKGKRMMLVLRAVLGCTSLMSQFYAIRYMPLADASVIIFSVPVFVAVFARIFLKEHFGLFHCVTIFCTLIGCTLIAKPPVLFGYLGDDYSSNISFTEQNLTEISNATIREEEELNVDPQSVFIGAVVALIGTIFAANVYVVVRALKELHFSVIMASFGFFAFIQTFTVTVAIGELALPPTSEDWILLFLLAFFSFGGQILLTMALHREQAGPVSIARSADIIFAFIWQMLFFHQVPTWLSIVGAFLVTCSVFLVAAKKWVEGLPNGSKLRRRLICLLY